MLKCIWRFSRVAEAPVEILTINGILVYITPIIIHAKLSTTGAIKI